MSYLSEHSVGGMPVLCPTLHHYHAVPDPHSHLHAHFPPSPTAWSVHPVGPQPSEKLLLLPASQQTLGDLELNKAGLLLP